MTERRRGQFARLLRQYRRAAGLTQRDLALRAALGERTVSDLERGVAAAPYDDTVRRLASALELTATQSSELRVAARPLSGTGAAATVAVRLLEAASLGELVARDAELERVVDLLGHAERGQGYAVLVAGEAGVGKTRLALEVCRRASDRRDQVVFGRCYDAQFGVPFTPFVEALSALSAVSPPELRAAAADRWPHLVRLLPDELGGPDDPWGASDGPTEVLRLFRAVTGFLRSSAADRPVVLVLDDLHWADRASLDLLLHLVRNTRADPILIIATYRDVEVGRRHPLRAVLRELDREETTVRIRLGNLSEDETATLVRGYWPSAASPPSELASQVYRRTDGNPFFVVETLTDLVERDTQLADAEDVSLLDPPVTVTEAILGRAARLGPATRHLLDVMSVLGPCDVDELLVVAGLGSVQIETTLEQVEDAGLLRIVGDRYVFDHSLTQEAVYADLSATRRRRLHHQVGAALERRGDRAQPGRAADIARHFRLGGAAARSLPHAVGAGRQAESVFAYAEAEQQYRQALDVATGDGAQALDVATGDGAQAVEAEVWERLGVVLTAQARYDEAFEALERAVLGYASWPDPAGVDRTEADIAMAYFRCGAPVQGIARLAAHLDSLAPIDDQQRRSGRAALQLALARLYYANAQYRECRAAAERGAALCRANDDVRLLAEIELWRGIGLLWSDAPDGGVTALTHALGLADSHQLLDVVGLACLPLHLAYALRGEFRRSHQYAERGIAAAERTGDLALLAMHVANRGVQQVYTGEWTGAEGDLRHAVNLAADIPTSYFTPLPSAYLGVLRLDQGRLEEAQELLIQAADQAHEAGNREVRGYARTQLLRLDVLRGRARSVIDRIGLDPDLTGTTFWYDVILLTVHATALLETDRPGEAEVVADRAVARARLMRNRLDGVAALGIRAEGRSRLGRDEEAAEDRAEAADWLVRRRA